MRRFIPIAALLGVFCSAAWSQTATTTTISVSPSTSAAFGTAVTLTATVTPASGTIAGSVIFYDDYRILGYGTINSGRATFSSSAFTVGVHYFIARYKATTSFAGSGSAFSKFTVTGAAAQRDAEFHPPLSSGTAVAPTSVAYPGKMVQGDFNGDGLLDIATITGSSQTAISVYLGTGTGTFASTPSATLIMPTATTVTGCGGYTPAAKSITSLVAVDLDGDGNLDLVAGASIGGGNCNGNDSGGTAFEIAWFPGDHAAAFGGTPAYFQQNPELGLNGLPASWLLVPGLAVGDYQHTGVPKIAFAAAFHANGNNATFATAEPQSNAIWVLGLNNSTPSSPSLVVENTAATFTFAPSALFGGDVGNGTMATSADSVNGSSDVFVVGTTGFDSFATNNTTSVISGSTQSALWNDVGESVTNNNILGAVTADFNSDGYADVALATATGLQVFFGSATGLASSPVTYAIMNGTTTIGGSDIAVADVNGDGYPDLIVDDGNSSTYVYLYNTASARTFIQPSYSPISTGTFPSGLVTGDFNGDGRPDFVVTNSGVGSGGNVSVFLGDAPVITSLAPSSTPATATTQSVTVTGYFPTATVGVTVTPTSGGSAVSATPTVTGINTLRFTVPSSTVLTTGTAPVILTDSATSTSSASSPLTVTSAPALASSPFSPSYATVNGGTFTLTITGTNLPTPTAPMTPVVTWKVGGVSATPLSVLTFTATTITATVPSSYVSTAGTATIGVQDPVSGATSGTATLSIVSGPVVSSINPTSVGAGSTQVSLTVNGTDFLTGDTVSFTLGTNTYTYTPSSIAQGNTSLTVNIPAAVLTTAGVASITVQNSSGVGSGAALFTIGNPGLTAISPNNATAGTSTDVTLTVNGTYFLPGISSVTWCNGCGSSPVTLSAASTPSPTATQLTVIVPHTLFATPGTAQIGVTNSSTSSSGTTLPFSFPSVSISSVTPTSVAAGSAGFTLTVNGADFVSGATVYLTTGSTANALATTFVSSNQLTAIVPSTLLTGANAATITVLVGTSTSNSVGFAVLAPTITSINPLTSSTGASTFTMKVVGSNFLTGSVVQWGNGSTVQSLTTAFTDANDLVAVVPASLLASAGTALVTVLNSSLNASASTSNGYVFTIGPAPTINSDSTGLTPSSSAVLASSAAPLQITVKGTNFQSGSTVFWNNGTNTALTTGVTDSTTLTATVPAALLAMPGAVIVTVQNPGPVTSNAVTFTVQAGTTPTAVTLVPSSIAAGASQFQIVVTGTNIVSGAVIEWNSGTSTTALATSFASGQLSAIVPATLVSTAGSAFVSITNPGNLVSNSLTFAISSNQPAINTTGGLSPSSATVSSGAFTLTVNGLNFVTGSTVLWNAGSGAQSVPTAFVSSTILTAAVPASYLASTGTALITVSNPATTAGGAASTSNTAIFSILPVAAPTINSANGVTPSTAVVGSQPFLITVSGTNFFSGSVVQWNSGTSTTSLSTSYISSTQLSAVVTSSLVGAAGTAFISVTNPGPISSNLFTFTIGTAAGPTINTLTPASVTAGSPAYQLFVSGTNFLATSVAQWNSGAGATSLATIYLSSTQLSALVPANLVSAAGTAFVDVMNSVGVVSNVQSYTISPGTAPTVNTSGGLSPSTVTVGSAGITMTISGTGFVSSSVAQWSTGVTPTALTTVFISSTQLNAIVPSTLLSAAGTAFVSVTNGAGNVSNSVPFTVAAQGAPTISTANGLLPASASAGGSAFQLVVIGTNFVSGAAVYWNSGTNQALTTSFVSATQLTAVVPAALIAASGVAFVSVQNPGAVTSNSVPFTIGPSGTLPTILSSGGLLPSAIPAGSSTFQLLVTGTNFQNGAVVQWNGGSGATSLTTGFGNSTSLSALVPASLVASPGNALVSVLNPDKGVSNSVTFSISGSVPVLTQLAPSTVPAGTQNLSLVISGTGFSAGNTVLWGSTPLPTAYISSSQLTGIVSAAQLAAVGSVSVTVQSAGGPSNAVAFTVTGPLITLLSPAIVTAGAPAFTLSVGGDNFVTGSVVNFGGTALSTTFVSANQLMAAVPATAIASANSVSVTVLNPGGATSPSFGFSVGAVPAIQSLSPSSASPGSPALTLQVTGSNFANGDTVQWNGVALVTTYGSATTLSAAVPATLLVNSGTVNVSVLHAGGVASNASPFTITSGTLTSISPTTAAAGSGTFQLTANGTSFVSGSVVQWNGTSLPTTFVNNTQLSATVNSSLLQAVGTAYVAVSNPGGSTTAGTTFTVAGPTLTSISPTTATAGTASLTLTLTGNNFVSNSVASWNGTALPTSVSGATGATASVPANLLATAGTYVVVVTNPGGAATAAQFFNLAAPAAPVLSGVTPASAVAGGPAFQITVAGSGFVSGAVIQWNGASQPTSYVGPTQLTALISASLIANAGTANITVQVPGAPLSSATPFPVNPPAISSLSPTNIGAGSSGFTLTVTGGNFIAGSSVQWNGTSLPTIFNSATSLSASVPSTLIVSAGTASITVQNAAGAVSSPVTFTIGPFTLLVSTTALPDAVVGTGYSQILSASGGTPPYTWTTTTGSLPAGIALDAPSGTLSGIPTAAVSGSIGFTVTDSVARTVTKSIPFRALSPLSITTTTPLTGAASGISFSQILAASGGATPYTWSASGSLPPGLQLNASSGQISGTPTVPGLYSFTINLGDGSNLSGGHPQMTSSPFSQTVAASGITIGGVSASATSAQQLPVNVAVASPFAVDLTGYLTLVFNSQVGAGDPAIQFGSGGTKVNFILPAGSTQASFGTQQSVALLTGTTAGTITVTATLAAAGANVTPPTAPVVIATIARAAPVITGVTLTSSGANLVVTVAGYSNTRDMTSGSFQFVAAAGSTLNAAPISVNLAPTFATFYQSSAGANSGSVFSFTVPFPFTGNIGAVGSVSVTLTNSAGTSAPATATRQ